MSIIRYIQNSFRIEDNYMEKKMSYDYLIVGAGLFGSIFAHEATKRGKKCLVI